jgi:hypothetical protein
VSLDDQGMNLKLKITDELGFEYSFESNNPKEIIKEFTNWVNSIDETPLMEINLIMDED